MKMRIVALLLFVYVISVAGCGLRESKRKIDQENRTGNQQEELKEQEEELCNTDLTKGENNKDTSDEIHVENNRGKKEENSDHLPVQTLTELNHMLISYIDKNYPNDEFTYSVDPYNDEMSIHVSEATGLVSAKEADMNYVLGITPVMYTKNLQDGQPYLGYTWEVNYYSGNFLDWYYDDVEAVILADDGTKYKFILMNIGQDSSENMYYTNFYLPLSYTYENGYSLQYQKELTDLLSKATLSMRFEKLNIENEYVEVTIDDETKGNMTIINELFAGFIKETGLEELYK